MKSASLVRTIKEKTFTCVVLLVSVGFYILTGSFEYTAKAGRLGPDFWPKTILLLIMAMSVLEIVVALFRGDQPPGAEKAEDSGEKEPAGTETGKRYPALMALGIALTVGYILLVSILGFALTTLLYLACFMYVGRYRKHMVIWVSSLVGTIFLVLVFIKLVYVSLPPGIPPFDNITYLIYSLLGII